MELRDQKGLTEREFLEQYKTKNYPRPYLTADVIFVDTAAESVLLIRRKGHPFLGHYALPGGFACADETMEQTAHRELQEETHAAVERLIPVGLYSTPGRDPRGWVVSQAYLALTQAPPQVQAGDDAAEAAWFRVSQEDGKVLLRHGSLCLSAMEDLAFDHGQMLLDALKILKTQKG